MISRLIRSSVVVVVVVGSKSRNFISDGSSCNWRSRLQQHFQLNSATSSLVGLRRFGKMASLALFNYLRLICLRFLGDNGEEGWGVLDS